MTGKPWDRLLLMPCSGTKKQTMRAVPAGELYTGPMWQTLRTHGRDLPSANIYILSGGHGFLRMRDTLHSYNARMTPEFADRLIAGGLDAPRQSGDRFPLRDVFASDRRGRPFDRVIIAGAGEYRRVFEALVVELRAAGIVTADAVVDQVAGGIGEQRSQLGSFLRGAQ